MNKRGIGAIVAMVLIILLVVGSIVIIWAVVRPIVEKTGEGAGEGQFSVVLQIEDFKVESDGNISLTVSRGASGPDLPSLRVIIFDGTDTTTFTTEGLDKMQTKKLTLPSGGLVKKISVAPVFESSGDEKIGNVGAKLEFSNKEVMKNHGAVAWWKLEGDAEDEIKGHDGTINENVGNPNCDAQGKFGNACYFEDSPPDSTHSEDYIKIVDSIDFDIGPEGFTYSVWINVMDYEDGWPESPINYHMIIGQTDHYFSVDNFGKIHLRLKDEDGGGHSIKGTSALVIGDWYHAVGTYDSENGMRVYLNGSLENSGLLSNIRNRDMPHYIGIYSAGTNNYPFTGTIDEPMIFNRALTAEEVQSLYNLDLG